VEMAKVQAPGGPGAADDGFHAAPF
jgi:hypothetical protein